MTDFDVIIVGAGIAGICAAGLLHGNGYNVVVIEKSKGFGGRMACRRIKGACCDHGAQFITARDARFKALMIELESKGMVQRWFGGECQGIKTHVRWRGAPAMTSIAKHLSGSIAIQLQKKVTHISSDESRWEVHLQTGEILGARGLILTPPVPQSRQLLKALEPIIIPRSRSLLNNFSYARCLAVMAVLSTPSNIDPPGYIREPSESIDWITDNQQKGISEKPALTIHASAEFSRQNWDKDRNWAAERLLDEVRRWVSLEAETYRIHAWKYSKPLYVHDQRFLELVAVPPLIMAGDAFGGPRVEGAALSGWSSAEHLEMRLR